MEIDLMRTVSCFLFGLVTMIAASAAAEQEEILFGSSTALTGPAADLGQNMTLGISTEFMRVNGAGGISGRKLRLITLDDGYEPTRTAPNMRELIDSRGVLGIIGNVGTPTAIVSIPIANELKTLLFAPFTGAGVLRKSPPDRYVINYRASYAEETAAMIDGLVGEVGVKPEEIAIFTQRDSYGDAGFRGAIEALKRRGLADESQIIHARYERNTLAVEIALADLLAAEVLPKAVVMVGAYAPCAKFIKLARENHLNPLFLNVSFVGAESLARDLGSEGHGVIVTQVVPPLYSGVPAVTEFNSLLAAYHPGTEPTYGALEGFIAARILVKALQTVSGPLDRERIIAALESLGEFSIETGEKLKLSPAEHQASHHVWLTTIADSKVVPVSWKEIRAIK